jgi:hypothetical protein
VNYRHIRLCALGTDRGKTKGYRETSFVAAPSGGLFHLDPPKPEDRAARLSATALATINTGSEVLFSALAVLYPDTNDLNNTDRARIRAAQMIFYDAVGHASIQLVFDLLHQRENAPEEQRRFNRLIAAEVREAFCLAATALIRPLHVARAEYRLEGGIHFRLKGEIMSKKFNPPLLARQTFSILREVNQHATPDDKARLRTMFLPNPPLSFWKLMAVVPQEHIDEEHSLSIWKRVLRIVGHVHPSSSSLGRTLQTLDFPEDRMDRLLTASGPSLPGLIDEALRWLVSHQVEAADLSVLATLGIADALGDDEARDWARKQVALDYVRSAVNGDRGKRRSQAPQQEAS